MAKLSARQKLELIRLTGFLEELPKERQLEFAELFQLVELKKGQILYKSGDVWPYLGVIVQGLLQKVEVNAHGRVYLVEPVKSGNVLGILSLIDGQAQTEAIQSITPSSLLVIDRECAWQMLESSVVNMQRLYHALTSSVRELKRHRMIMTIPNTYQRINALLSQFVVERDGQFRIEGLPSQMVFAEMANTSRETVSRAMQELVKKGVLERTKGALYVLAPQELMLQSLA